MPISVTFSPVPATVDPTASMSIVISASSASEESLITRGVAAVVVVFSHDEQQQQEQEQDALPGLLQEQHKERTEEAF